MCLAKLFGKKNNGGEYPIKTTKATVSEMVGFTHEFDKTDYLWNEVVANETSGVYKYSIKTDKWEYRMRNGTYILNPIGPKQ